MAPFELGPRKPLYRERYGSFEVEVYSLPLHRTVVYEMSGFPRSEYIDRYLDGLLDVARRERPVGMVADPRRMHVLASDFQHAVQTRFWPAAALLGVRRNPAILPPLSVTDVDVLRQSSVRRMVGRVGETITSVDGKTLEIALLPSLEACVRWIDELGQQP